MGNYTSCYFPGPSNSETAKLFDSHGNLQRLKLPLTAAELMLEHPGHAIASVEDLRRTRLISGKRADDELLAGKVYLLVSSGRVHCRVSELEMAIIDLACKKKAPKLKPCGSKVLPAMGGEVITGLPGLQQGSHRRWSPALEPISEGF
ncbi:hypothetical protein I3843_08G087800 [Carya illinoinensis]|uniref:Uncharacterized protein n=1 Tax=Carya illinoinensis TaxID=32201 RepID=A0A8T1PU88_CARIL|nr:uncharacterized protein LOC122274407 [Carya illinoinensis]KAG6644991.1 hypothetical protein CIPAW_08G090700 [Carya illinoinensis]KAG7967213.1 hypothetical protein I3843_08G087800 [Carya illinoinensis]